MLFHKNPFSHHNNAGTGRDGITPTRLGRELIESQENLKAVHHKISSLVYPGKSPTVPGFTEQIINVTGNDFLAFMRIGEAQQVA